MQIQNKNILVIGGSSGLGFGLAVALDSVNKVIVTGRTDPKREGLEFRFLELCEGSLSKNLDVFIAELPVIDIVIYAAGSYERGSLQEMTDGQLLAMHNIYFLAPTLLLARLLKKQNGLSGFIAVSSISQLIPKATEAVYCGLKAGFGMLARCLSLDSDTKVLVVSPARFGENGSGGARDGCYGKLDSAWVIETIFAEYDGNFRYKLVAITRDPAKVEVREVRNNQKEGKQ